jgi:hypothetical protein
MKSSFQRSEYERVFEQECAQSYPTIDAYEVRTGYAIHPRRLESAARVLACPVKSNRPNWQHGRVIYSTLMKYLEGRTEPLNLFDCGTAKGFSALCMAFALNDAKATGTVNSVDVVDPAALVPRNSILDCERLRTVHEFVVPWPESDRIRFHHLGGSRWLKDNPARVHFAFVDGKHAYASVLEETKLLTERQEPGDVAIFDDLQIEPVAEAVMVGTLGYRVEFLDAKPDRRYAIATRS